MDNPDQLDKILLPVGTPANDGENPGQDGGSGRISKKRLQRERLILALFEYPTLAKAAASIGISYSTARRIIKTREFEEECRAHGRQLMTQVFARSQHASGASVSKLIKLMSGKDKDKDVPYAIQLRAAEAIIRLAQSAQLAEDIDVRVKLARLEALEAEEPSPKKPSKRPLPDWLLQPWAAQGLRVEGDGQPDQDALREFFNEPRCLRETADVRSEDTAFSVMDKENIPEDKVA